MKSSVNKKRDALERAEYSAKKVPELMAKFPHKSLAQIDLIVMKEFQQIKKTPSRTLRFSTARPKTSTAQKASSEPKELSSEADFKKRLTYSIQNQQKANKPHVEPPQKEQIIQDPQATPLNKRKTLKKQKIPNQYLKFFKFYYSKLKKDHPRWISSQINEIVSLLWKKHQIISKKKSPASMKMTKSFSGKKPTSGKTYFKDAKRYQGLQASQIKMKWNILPKESKNYWMSEALKAGGFQSPEKLTTEKIRFQNRTATPIKQKIQQKKQPLSFMKNLIF